MRIQFLLDFVHGGEIVLASLHTLEQDHELIATQPRNRIGVAKAGGETFCHFGQHGVAHMVAVLIVDVLEVIQVHIQDAHLAAVAMGMADRLLQPVIKQPPVGQSGQRIMRGFFTQRRTRAFKLHHLVTYLQ